MYWLHAWSRGTMILMKRAFTSAAQQGHASRPRSAVRVQRVRRCTYCRLWKDVAEFTKEGDHVVPESMGGSWIDHSVCELCNGRANENADILITQDFLIRFLRAMYEIPDRNNTIPKPPVVAVPVGGGVIKVTLTKAGPTFVTGLSASAIDELSLEDPTDQDRLRCIVDAALGASEWDDSEETRALARRSQPLKTPRTAWSRFMAKIGLACGREAYGENWLDTRQARTLSADLLGDHPPRFGQRWHYPPVEAAWPYEPPKHRLWIEPFENTAILKVALFGQVLGAVPVNDLPADAYPSAWSLDPHGRTGESRTHRSTFEAMHLATVARRAENKGGTSIAILDPDRPFVYIPDGPDGAVDLGVQLPRVDSLDDAVAFVQRERER